MYCPLVQIMYTCTWRKIITVRISDSVIQILVYAETDEALEYAETDEVLEYAKTQIPVIMGQIVSVTKFNV